MSNDSQPSANQLLLNGYLAYLGNEKQYSPLTLENYARDIQQLFHAAGDISLKDLKSHQLRRFIAQLHGRGLGGKSLARMLSAWRGFYTYLIRDHHINITYAAVYARQNLRATYHTLCRQMKPCAWSICLQMMSH